MPRATVLKLSILLTCWFVPALATVFSLEFCAIDGPRARRLPATAQPRVSVFDHAPATPVLDSQSVGAGIHTENECRHFINLTLAFLPAPRNIAVSPTSSTMTFGLVDLFDFNLATSSTKSWPVVQLNAGLPNQ